ncbi:unnamed protein product [Arctogadus glacialis]
MQTKGGKTLVKGEPGDNRERTTAEHQENQERNRNALRKTTAEHQENHERTGSEPGENQERTTGENQERTGSEPGENRERTSRELGENRERNTAKIRSHFTSALTGLHGSHHPGSGEPADTVKGSRLYPPSSSSRGPTLKSHRGRGGNRIGPECGPDPVNK